MTRLVPAGAAFSVLRRFVHSSVRCVESVGGDVPPAPLPALKWIE